MFSLLYSSFIPSKLSCPSQLPHHALTRWFHTISVLLADAQDFQIPGQSSRWSYPEGKWLHPICVVFFFGVFVYKLSTVKPLKSELIGAEACSDVSLFGFSKK